MNRVKAVSNGKPETRPLSKAVIALLARAEQDYRKAVNDILVLSAADEAFPTGETWNLNLDRKCWEKV